jgi:hypothetical protein
MEMGLRWGRYPRVNSSCIYQPANSWTQHSLFHLTKCHCFKCKSDKTLCPFWSTDSPFLYGLSLVLSCTVCKKPQPQILVASLETQVSGYSQHLCCHKFGSQSCWQICLWSVSAWWCWLRWLLPLNAFRMGVAHWWSSLHDINCIVICS